jgi:hypothetical protein
VPGRTLKMKAESVSETSAVSPRALTNYVAVKASKTYYTELPAAEETEGYEP